MAGTQSNAGRKFCKCPRKGSSNCGFWEWCDEEYPQPTTLVLNKLKISLDEVCEERANLLKEVDKLGACNTTNLLKISKLEAKLQRWKMYFLLSWVAFLGFIVARFI